MAKQDKNRGINGLQLCSYFAIAYAALGRVYGDIGESTLSAESTSQAYQLRNRASDEEKFFITASYDKQVTGNLGVDLAL